MILTPLDVEAMVQLAPANEGVGAKSDRIH